MVDTIDFPLYTRLKLESHSIQDIPDIWKYVINLPLDHLEIIYALIWHHSLSESTPQKKSSSGGVNSGSSKKISIPYKGKVFDTGKGIIFHVKDIPLELQKILSCYVLALVDDKS